MRESSDREGAPVARPRAAWPKGFVPVWVAAAGAGALLAGGVVLGVAAKPLASALAGSRGLAASQTDFEASVHGRTRQEVQAKYGSPDELVPSTAGPWDRVTWVYRGQFRAADGTVAPMAQLYFHEDPVGTVGSLYFRTQLPK